LQRKGFGYDRASVALDVWDSVAGHSDSMGRQMAVFQSLTTPDRILQNRFKGVVTFSDLSRA